jgi:DNA replication and repair protein RecF
VTDFRLYETVSLQPAEGLTVIRGPNGTGKTSLLEAAGYLASLSSFRGATTAELVRTGTASAVVRGEFAAGERRLLVEMRLPSGGGRTRVQVNRQPLRRAADLQEEVHVQAFQPDDLTIVKGPPGARRDAIDDAIVSLRPRAGEERRRLAACLRQRNALLRQAGAGSRGAMDEAAARSLDVWDDRLAAAAEVWAERRTWVVGELAPRLQRLFAELAGDTTARIDMTYAPEWLRAGMTAALAESRSDDLLRAMTTVGPHRDDVEWRLDGLATRTHASQGNQRSLALAFRLAVQEALTEAAGTPPLLLLDDVFSELDPLRQARLLDMLPAGQILLATAGQIPVGARPSQVVSVADLVATPSASR